MAAPIFREAVLTGPRLIARSPLSFLAWVLLRIVEQYVTLSILLGARGAGAALGVGPVWSVLASLPFEAVLIAALLRAALRPEDKRFAYMRLGRIELRMAGVLILAGLAGLVISVPMSILAAYVAYFLQQRILAGQALAIGSLAAALVLLRLAPAPAILVDEGRFDPGAAWRASKGRYVLLALVILAAAAIERGLGEAGRLLLAPTGAASWRDFLQPLLLASIAWRSLIGVASLAVMAGAVATVWKSRQTLS
jgi:hypothetical protein